MSERPIRIVLVDDQAMVRAGLALVLGSEPEFSVVGQCEDGTGVLAAVHSQRPDLVLMDVRMPRMTGPKRLGDCAPTRTRLRYWP